MTTYALGIDIGGTKIAAGLVADDGPVVESVTTVRTPVDRGPDAILDATAELAQSVLTGLDAADSGGFVVGVGAAGVIDRAGTVFSAAGTIPGWQGTDLRGQLGTRLHAEVRVLNDVHAAALAEREWGAARGLASFLMVTVGTGVGGAIVRDGRLDTGRTGTSGSVGHIASRVAPLRECSCGQRGHVEASAAGPAMETAYAQSTGRRRSVPELARAAAGGDLYADAVINDAADALGVGLADALNVLDVEAVVIGGGLMSLGPRYLDRVRRTFQGAALPGPAAAAIHPAALGTTATLAGAGLAVLRTPQA